MRQNQPATELLLQRAGEGSASAVEQLLALHRPRLRRMVAAHWPAQLTARVDPSDIVQETLAEVPNRLSEYLQQTDLPFYAWLHRLANQRLIDLYRRHVLAARRSVRREEPLALRLSPHSSQYLADRLPAEFTEAGADLQQQEQKSMLRRSLDRLDEQAREILVLLYLEDCTAEESAAILGVSARTVRRKHREALKRLAELLHP